jgi:hypothetical protein
MICPDTRKWRGVSGGVECRRRSDFPGLSCSILSAPLLSDAPFRIPLPSRLTAGEGAGEDFRVIVYISIGNSDDKLSQMQWGKYYRKVDLTIQGYRQFGGRVHGRWVSASTDYWQNACWCLEIQDHQAAGLREELRLLAGGFNQDSIAWAEVGETQFLEPED